MKLTQKIRNEAKRIAGGLFRMNAKGADRYGFNIKENEIYYGEFLFISQSEDRVDWILDLKTNKFRKAKVAIDFNREKNHELF